MQGIDTICGPEAAVMLAWLPLFNSSTVSKVAHEYPLTSFSEVSEMRVALHYLAGELGNEPLGNGPYQRECVLSPVMREDNGIGITYRSH